MTNSDHDDNTQPTDNIFKLARICAGIGAVGAVVITFLLAYMAASGGQSYDMVAQMVLNVLCGFGSGFGLGFLLELGWGPFFPGKTKQEVAPDVNTTSTKDLPVHIDYKVS